jgi:hypothetical protein
MRSRTGTLLTTKDLPGMRRYWRQRRGYFYPEFADYIDGLFGGDGSSDAVDGGLESISHWRSLELPT